MGRFCENCFDYCGHCDEGFVDVEAHEGGCDYNYDHDESAYLESPGIHDYGYQPAPKFFGKSPDGLFFGVEHEVELTGDRNEAAQMVLDLANSYEESNKLLYVKSDSSLEEGIEIVSHPMSFDFFHKSYPFGYMNKLDTWDSDDAGVHIHMSSAAFKARYHLMRFMMFHFNEGRDLATQIAGRVSDYGRFTMDRMSRQEWQRITTAKQRTGTIHDVGLWPDRFLAVNVTPVDTCELRYFKSTVQPNRFKAYLQFADAVYRYTYWARVKPKAGQELRQMDVQGFLWWLTRGVRPKRYGELTALIDREVRL